MALISQSEIQAEYQNLLAELRRHQRMVEFTRASLKSLEILCDHPNGYTYYVMGETGTKCPDCGYQT